MSRFRAFLFRLRGLFRGRRLESELSDELRTHLDSLVERNLAAGLSPDEARYAALRAFGGVAQIEERARDERRSAWGDQLLQDLRYAARQLGKNRGFTLVVVVTLGLAIGVNSATFSLLRDLFLRPLMRDAQANVVQLHTRREGSGARDRDFRRFSWREFAELRAEPGVLADVAAMGFVGGAIGRGGNVQPGLFCLVSENYFSVLNVRPLAGRFFTADEARPDAALPVAVVNHAHWQRLGGPEAKDRLRANRVRAARRERPSRRASAAIAVDRVARKAPKEHRTVNPGNRAPSKAEVAETRFRSSELSCA